MPEGLFHYDSEAELAADEAAAREHAKREHLRIVPDSNEATSSGLPDPAEATGADSLGGGYASQRSNLTLIDEQRDWSLDPRTIETGRRGVANSRAELAAAEERLRLRENPTAQTPEPREDLDPE